MVGRGGGGGGGPQPNQPPTANNDAYSTPVNIALNVPAPGVLGNDTDPENNPLTASPVTGPTNGTLSLGMNGSFTYTPNAGFNGVDSFTYVASDGNAPSNTATATITVGAPPNNPPVAVNDSYPATEDTPLTVTAPGVLSNDTDADANPLTAVLVSQPAAGQGTVTLNANGSFTYTPVSNFNGATSFTYKANDGQADSNIATVTLTVAAVNDAPVANNDAYSTPMNTPLTVGPPGVLSNDSDVEGSALTAVNATPPTSGTVTLNPDGSFTYTPAAGFSGPASFTYQANDGALNSPAAMVNINVNTGPPPAVPAFVYLPYHVDVADGGGEFVVKSDNFVLPPTTVVPTGTAAPTSTAQTVTDSVVLNADSTINTLFSDRLIFIQNGQLFFSGLRDADAPTTVTRFSSEAAATNVCETAPTATSWRWMRAPRRVTRASRPGRRIRNPRVSRPPVAPALKAPPAPAASAS